MEENKLTDEEIVKDMIAHKRAADAYAFVQITGPQMQRWLDLINRLQDDYSKLKERYVKVLDLNEKVIAKQKAEIERLKDEIARLQKQVDELKAENTELYKEHTILIAGSILKQQDIVKERYDVEVE